MSSVAWLTLDIWTILSRGIGYLGVNEHQSICLEQTIKYFLVVMCAFLEFTAIKSLKSVVEPDLRTGIREDSFTPLSKKK